MSEKSEKIYDGITLVGDDLIGEAQNMGGKKKNRRVLRWLSSAAALILAVTAAATVFTRNAAHVYAVAEAVYPEENVARGDPSAYSEGMADFLKQSIPTFLSGADGENRVYSPANLYVALSMLAEVTGGESREQILSLLGSDSVEVQREKADAFWNAEYFNRKSGKALLANSLWLNESVNFVPDTMNTLAERYYASSYRGDPASEGFSRALRDWVNEQTGGLLSEHVNGLGMNERTVLEMVSTVYFRGTWSDEFDPKNTKPGTFHAADGDLTVDFMYDRAYGAYFRGERFTAVLKSFTNGRTMVFALPDEGVTPEDLLTDAEFISFFSGFPYSWEQNKYLFVNLTVPKFDVDSNLDLTAGMRSLGVTDVFEPDRADFTPMTGDLNPELEAVYLSRATHAARVMIDEEGCTAASYVDFGVDTGGMLTEDEADFTLDRPFLFAISRYDVPLFVGIVNQP